MWHRKGGFRREGLGAHCCGRKAARSCRRCWWGWGCVRWWWRCGRTRSSTRNSPETSGRGLRSSILVCGGVLGMGLVAKESSKGTLSFLLGKPLSAQEVLLPKYVVGSVALLVLVAGAWATVYLDLEGLASRGYNLYGYTGDWYFSLKQFAEEVGYVNMLLVSPYDGIGSLQPDLRQFDGVRSPAQRGDLGQLCCWSSWIMLSDSVLQLFPHAQAVLLLRIQESASGLR